MVNIIMENKVLAPVLETVTVQDSLIFLVPTSINNTAVDIRIS
jgi:hypothetical protein